MIGCFSRLWRPSSIHPPPNELPSQVAGEPPTALFKSFNSLFDPSSDSDARTPSSSQTLTLASSSSSSAAEHDLISSAIASSRLFPASPGQSNSIIDSPSLIISVGSAGVAVSTYSPDPYSDFRQSMEEMVRALGISGRKTHPDLVALRELLCCYLALNCKHAHKYIISAFTDLLFSLAAGDGKSSGDG